MSTLQVANIHFETTGSNRIEYTGNNVVRVQGKGLVIPRIDTANTPSPEPGMMFYNTSTNSMVMMSNTSAAITIPSNTVVEAAFAKANAALANTSGTFSGNLGITGNLGAGNTSPVYKLDVDLSSGGKVARFQSSAGGDPYITVEDNTGAISYMFQNRGSYGGIGSLSNNGFAIRTINTDRIYIGATGDVGVGTMAEAGNTLRYFDLQNANTGSSAGVITRMITSNSTGTGITTVDIVKYKNGLFVINNNDPAGTFTFNNAGSERMRITSGGNIGIGTNSPGFKTEIVCGYNNGLQVKDDTSTVYGGYFTESGTMALVTRSNHGLRFGTNDTTRMNITSTGNVSIGTTSVTSAKFNLKGRQRIIAPGASSSNEENRWYSHQGHYNIASVDNNAYSNLLMFRPYQNGTTSDPPGSSLWTRVGVEVRIGGHSSAIGSGDRWARYSLDYNGSGCSGATTLQDLATSNAPRVNFSISGWQVTLQVSGAGGSAGSLGGYCYVSVHFGGGEGGYGEAIEWSLTEYL